MLKNKTLLYLASGEYRDIYEMLPYEKIILVDKSPRYKRVDLPVDSKVTFLNMEATAAVSVLKKNKIKIDCLVIINEGLYGGGAIYPFYSDFFIGFLHPILSDEFLLVTDIKHYESCGLKTRIGKMNWGIEKIKSLKPNINDVLKPGIFSYTQHALNDIYNLNYGNIFHLRLVQKDAVYRSFGNITLELKHGSIWKDENDLDAIGCFIKESRFKEINFSYLCKKTNQKVNLFDVDKLSFDKIISLCQEKKIKHIGLVPWLKGEYSVFFDWIQKNKVNSPIKITLYHLNKEDYKALYPCFGIYFYTKYKYLFYKLYEDPIQWNIFESVLDMKTGYFLDKMCHEIDLYYKNNPNIKNIPFSQIKLKFGRVIIYMSMNRDKYINALINLTKSLINSEL